MSGVEAWVRSHPVVADAVLAAGVAAVTLPASLPLVWCSDWPLVARLAVAGTMLVLHAAIVTRRRTPSGSFVVGALAMLAIALAPDLDGAAVEALGGGVAPVLLPSSLVFPVLLYAVAAHGRGRPRGCR